MNHRILLAGIGMVAVSGALPAQGQPSVSWTWLSSDTTVELDEAGGGTSSEQDIVVDNLLGIVLRSGLGALPASGDISGYELLPNGDQLLCFDATVQLPGPLYVPRGDVVRYDGSSYSTEFDASANGVPAGAVCDAVALDSLNGLILSFDVTVELPDGLGGTIVAADEDAVQVDGPSSFMLLDASTAGVPVELDADGLDILPNGDFVGSYDTGGTLGTVVFGDEDLLHLDAGTGVWSLLVDSSAQDADWGPGDIDALAVPEPSRWLMLASGIGALSLLGQRRSRMR